jgi:hypothetical protein
VVDAHLGGEFEGRPIEEGREGQLFSSVGQPHLEQGSSESSTKKSPLLLYLFIFLYLLIV